MTALAITAAALILCYPLSLIAGALDRVAEALQDDKPPSLWNDER